MARSGSHGGSFGSSGSRGGGSFGSSGSRSRSSFGSSGSRSSGSFGSGGSRSSGSFGSGGSHGGGSFGGSGGGRGGGSFGSSGSRSRSSFGSSGSRSSGSFGSGGSRGGGSFGSGGSHGGGSFGGSGGGRGSGSFGSGGGLFSGGHAGRRPSAGPNPGMHGNPGQPGGGTRSGCGCGTLTILAIVVIVIVMIAGSAESCNGGYTSSNSTITASTVEREKLSASLVNETGYYSDETGSFIESSSTLTSGLKSFYQQTGVQPYVYITDNINGDYAPGEDTLDAFAESLYNELFTDEGHLLFVYVDLTESDGYLGHIVIGYSAQTVIDDEAYDILVDYINAYYYDSSLSNAQFISNAFEDAGERIMHVEKSAWPYVFIILGAIAILVILFLWWKKRKEQKNIEAQQTEDILNTPLEKFGDPDAEELARKYSDKDDDS